ASAPLDHAIARRQHHQHARYGQALRLLLLAICRSGLRPGAGMRRTYHARISKRDSSARRSSRVGELSLHREVTIPEPTCETVIVSRVLNANVEDFGLLNELDARHMPDARHVPDPPWARSASAHWASSRDLVSI